MRNSTLFFLGIGCEVIILSVLLMHASFSENARQAILEEKAALVKNLRLTDLCFSPKPATPATCLRPI